MKTVLKFLFRFVFPGLYPNIVELKHRVRGYVNDEGSLPIYTLKSCLATYFEVFEEDCDGDGLS